MTRRELIALAAALPLARGQSAKRFRGVFPIMATPYTTSNGVDFEDLAAEVDFLARCGVPGMVWPQLASEYSKLTREERMRGMEVLAKAARGKKPALVLGVQGPNVKAALEYLEHAEQLNPDAVIAIPPTEAKSLEDVREYYRALAKRTSRPLFVQTTGGAKGITLTVPFLVELAQEFPNCGYIKEETEPVLERGMELGRHRPQVHAVFSGAAGKGMLYEARLGFDGTMPGAPYSDVYVRIYDLWDAGKRSEARDVFAQLLLMINLEQQIHGTRQYIMKKRGVFKNIASRQQKFHLSPEDTREIDFTFEGLRPYLKA